MYKDICNGYFSLKTKSCSASSVGDTLYSNALTVAHSSIGILYK